MKKFWSIAVLLGLAVALVSLPAAAQNCGPAPNSGYGADYAAYAQWCRSCNETPYNNHGVGCTLNGGGGGGGGGVDPNNGFYQLGYRFGCWLLGGCGSKTNAADEALRQQQQQEMMAELRRRQEEAEREHREEEARRLAAMYNRLASSLKLVGLPHLQMKFGDSAQGYGIPGLPGIYTGGPGPGSGMTPKTPSMLKLKTGADALGAELAGNASPTSQPPSDGPGYGIQGLPGIYTGGPTPSGLKMKMGDGGDVPPAPPANTMNPATVDFNKMSPKQLADMAEQFSKLPPEEQQRLLSGAQYPSASSSQQGVGGQRNGWSAQPAGTTQSPSGTQQPGTRDAPTSSQLLNMQDPTPSLQRQAQASQSAAGASTPEGTSSMARAGFDTPLGGQPVQLNGNSSTPALLYSPSPVPSPRPAPGPQPAPTAAYPPPSKVSDDVIQYLFSPNRVATPFPRDPNPQLNNPLREDVRLQAQLKMWDDWAHQQATHIHDSPPVVGGTVFPGATVEANLYRDAIQHYAPELLNRYDNDAAFRLDVNHRLQNANDRIALQYYQLQADVHKLSVLAFQEELDRLVADGRLDKLTPLGYQLAQNPQLQLVVQAARDRVNASEQAGLSQAQVDGASRVDKEYKFVFQFIRMDAQQR